MTRKKHRRQLQISPRPHYQKVDSPLPLRLIKYIFGSLLIVALAVTFVYLTQPQRSLPSPLRAMIDDHYDPMIRSMPKYVKLFDQALPTPIDEELRPVHIYKNNKWHCSGTALRWSATSEVILTTLHGFGRSYGNGRYTYRVMSPFDPIDHSIATVKVAPGWQEMFGREPDIAMCLPGPSQFVRSISDLNMVDPNQQGTVDFDPLTKDYWAISLLTGERCRCLFAACDIRTKMVQHLVFDYDSIYAESGSGFLIEGWPGALMVLAGHLNLRPQMQQTLLPPGYTKLQRAAYGYVFSYKREEQGLRLSPIGTTE